MTAQQFLLFEQFGQYYDLHTPEVHYQHDHLFVIDKIKQVKADAKLLDIGCGTGFFIQKALSVGLEPIGLDPSKPMLESAAKKVDADRLIHAPMQVMDFVEEFDAITALSWSINYCADKIELKDVLTRCYRALKSPGVMILQTAHAANAAQQKPAFYVDSERGPGGEGDIVLRYRFWSEAIEQMNAEYHYQCVSQGDNFDEVHHLKVANANLMADTAKQVGFVNVGVVNDRLDSEFTDSISPFVIAYKQ